MSASDPLALEGRGERPLNAVARAPMRPEAPLLDELAERIAAAPRGLIVAGRQSDLSLGEPIAALAESTGYPVLAEPTSQLRWGPHAGPATVSAYDLISRGRPPALEPELIVRVGELPTSKPLRRWLGAIRGLRQIVIDPTGAWKEPTRTAETLLRAEPAAVASELAARLAAARSAPARDEDAGWALGWAEAERAVRAAVDDELATLESLSEPGVWPVLAAALADGDQVLAASSMPVRDMEGYLPPGAARVRFISNRGANGIDGLVSTAAGAAASGARTWAVIGDLALAHDLGGLAAASGVPSLQLIVIDNAGGGIFHFLPQAEAMDPGEFEALLGTPSGLEPERAAALFGIESAVPGTPGELERALAGDTGMVVVRTHRDQNLELHGRLADAAAAALMSA